MSIQDLIATLESSMRSAHHPPGEWASSPNEMGAVVTRSTMIHFWQKATSEQDDKPTPEPAWAHFHYKRDGWLAIEAVNALPKLIEYIRHLEQQNESRTTTNAD